jgi:hypothetical protein
MALNGSLVVWVLARFLRALSPVLAHYALLCHRIIAFCAIVSVDMVLEMSFVRLSSCSFVVCLPETSSSSSPHLQRLCTHCVALVKLYFIDATGMSRSSPVCHDSLSALSLLMIDSISRVPADCSDSRSLSGHQGA